MVVIDAHVHVFKAVSDRYPRGTDEQFPASLEEPVEPLIDLMDANGVNHAVLVPLTHQDHYIREVVAAHPGRFAWIGVHDPLAEDPVTGVEHRGDRTGMRGLRVFHLGDPTTSDVRSLALFPLLETIARRGDILWFYGSPEQQALLVRVLKVLPGLRVMLNHLGFSPPGFAADERDRSRITSQIPPTERPAIQRLATFGGVHVMFSGQYAFSTEAFPHSDLQRVTTGMYETFGADRLVWASDYPWIREVPGYPQQLELVDHLLPGLPAADRAAILGGNAARLFGFAGDG